MSGAILTLVAQVGLRILEPWPLKFVFDRIISTSSQRSTDLSVLDRLAPGWLLALCALSLVVIIGL